MSVNDAAGANRSPVTGRFAALSRDVFAGLITSTISVAYGLSFAALIFAPPLTPWIAYGIAATFLTTAISAAFVAARSSLPFAIAGPDGATVAVTATLVVALLGRLSAEGAPDDLLAPVMIVMATFGGAHRSLVLWAWRRPRRRRHPLHPLPCHWRFSRRDRLADDERGRARDHRSRAQSFRHGQPARAASPGQARLPAPSSPSRSISASAGAATTPMWFPGFCSPELP